MVNDFQILFLLTSYIEKNVFSAHFPRIYVQNQSLTTNDNIFGQIQSICIQSKSSTAELNVGEFYSKMNDNSKNTDKSNFILTITLFSMIIVITPFIVWASFVVKRKDCPQNTAQYEAKEDEAETEDEFVENDKELLIKF